jgi:hypothetical protein
MLGESFYRIGIERLVARHFFQSWDTLAGAPGTAPMKVGILVGDSPDGNYALRTIDGQLARHGIKHTEVIRTSGDLAQQQSEAQNAVLRFHADGITHVFGAGLAFMESAEGQHYRPRYFLAIEPSIFAQSAPAAQLQGSMGESYIPTLDSGKDPGPPSAATTLCEKVMQAAGQPPTWGTTLWQMESLCDGFFFLQDAVNTSGVLSTAGLQQGLNSLGSRIPSAVTWQTYLGPGQHASANALRDLAFDPNCSCYFYVSKQNFS